MFESRRFRSTVCYGVFARSSSFGVVVRDFDLDGDARRIDLEPSKENPEPHS